MTRAMCTLHKLINFMNEQFYGRSLEVNTKAGLLLDDTTKRDENYNTHCRGESLSVGL